MSEDVDTSLSSTEAMEEYVACEYIGTDLVEVKIWLIGVAGVLICILCILLNTFFSIVFWTNKSIRMTPVFYFGILAFIDIVMAFNYITVMAVPVYMDYFESLPIYHLFLSYFRVMLTESATVMFLSMLLIVAATTERLLRTFHSRNIIRVRKYLEQHRPLVCIWCIVVSLLYKICTYFEVTYADKSELNCTGFARYEITPTQFVADNADYRFWWMFLTRNIVDRIAPFFILVIMNILIIGALHKEYRRMAEPNNKMSVAEPNGGLQRVHANKSSRSSLRDATRALISLVTTYLISQTLQVIMTFWETLDKKTLESDDYIILYSYLNDVVSFMPMIAGCIRYPVYCACNKSIRRSSLDLLRKIKNCLLSDYYLPIAKNSEETGLSTTVIPVETKINAINGHHNCEKLPSTVITLGKGVASMEDLSDPLTDDSEHEWQL